MYKKILVPMALDHGISAKTLEVSQTLLDPEGEIVALHVFEVPQAAVSYYLDEDIVDANFKAATAALDERVATIDHATPVILKGHTSRTIMDYADSNGIDCIVIGSHKPGMADYFLGSTAARIVRHAGCSVHVLRTHD